MGGNAEEGVFLYHGASHEVRRPTMINF
jgi:hypothetical protein